MKIHILPVQDQFRPTDVLFRCPAHGEDWDVERDMLAWLQAHQDLVTDDPDEADWDYFAPFWNRYYLHSWGQGGLEELQAEIVRLVNRSRPTFTVCEYDIKLMQKEMDLCGMTVFCASRQDDTSLSIDVPLLCSPHDVTVIPEKCWLASFMGDSGKFSPRLELAEMLPGRADVDFQPGGQGEAAFVEQMLSSYIALAPRGHGGQSFRFYEAMQLGVAPMHIGTPDTRPFKPWIDWDQCSLYAATAEEAVAILDNPPGRGQLLAMGRRAAAVYDTCLRYGKWTYFVIEALRQLR